jgi:FtsP/CotA-like multicopper oxidase with cupredoxin domain
MAMLPGQAQLWRVINGSSNGYYNVSVDGVTLRLVALDGVPLDAYPHGHEQMVRDVVIPPAGRAEFVFRSRSQMH